MNKDFEKKTEPRRMLPPYIRRVTGGRGGEAYLILGTEKTALYDCGMACFSDILIANVERELEREAQRRQGRQGRQDPQGLLKEVTLDYILISHTHYDHIGALPYVLRRWPAAEVAAAGKAKEVFASERALATMTMLGEAAKSKYGVKTVDITAEGMRVDRVVSDGVRIALGGMEVEVYETKGHTDCALSFMLLPMKILFASESTGVPSAGEMVYSVPLKSFEQSEESARKLRESEPETLILPHYGRLYKQTPREYFDAYIKCARAERTLIEEAVREGLSDGAILERHRSVYWTEARSAEQPLEAYEMNTKIIIASLRRQIAGE